MDLSNTVLFYDFGKFRLDVNERQLLKNNEPIILTQKSFELLVFLIQNRGIELQKNQFFKGIWAESNVEETNLTQHIYRIRKALENDQNEPTYIETIPKFGYRFNADVREVYTDSTSQTNNYNNNGNKLAKDPGIEKIEKPIFTAYEENLTKSQNALPQTLDIQKNSKLSLGYIFARKTIFTLIFGSLLLFALLQTYFYFSPIKNNQVAIAILPFKQIGESKDEKLSVGMTDTIIAKLGNINNVTVTPTESVLSYAENNNQHINQDVFEIGKALKSDIILTGTIQRENGKARVTIIFYDVKEKRQLCTAKFDNEFSDIFSLQDLVSERTAMKLASEIEEHIKKH